MADEVGTALVTGAGSGIGKAIAIALVGAGYRLVAADIDAASAARLAAELGEDRVFPLRLDVTDKPAVDSLLAGISGRRSSRSTCWSTMPATT